MRWPVVTVTHNRLPRPCHDPTVRQRTARWAHSGRVSDDRLLELRGTLQVRRRHIVHCPPRLLAGTDVIRCFGFDIEQPVPVRRRKIPGGTVKIVFALDGVFDGVRRDPAALVVGMHDRGSTVTSSGRMRSVQLQLDPLVARRVLGVPLHELRNTAVPLDTLIGPSARYLAEQLAESARWEESFRLVAGFLRDRDAPRSPDPAVTAAVHRLRREHGTVPVADLVAESGWSRRHFGRRFADEVGLPASAYAGLMRFSAVLTGLTQRPAAVAGIAARFGYFDQSHLIRDFQRFAGTSPGRLLRETVAHSSNTGLAGSL